jgi:hypothetical protein
MGQCDQGRKYSAPLGEHRIAHDGCDVCRNTAVTLLDDAKPHELHCARRSAVVRRLQRGGTPASGRFDLNYSLCEYVMRLRCDKGANSPTSPDKQVSARQALEAWKKRLVQTPPATDCAADALAPSCEWNTYIQAMGGFISGARLEQISAADFAAYDTAATSCNWRVPAGYGTLIAASLPPTVVRRLSTPAQAIDFDVNGVCVTTPAGTLRARTAITTVSTSVLAGPSIRMPAALDAWRHAATLLPLGKNEKLFLEITGDSPFGPETQVLGNRGTCEPEPTTSAPSAGR